MEIISIIWISTIVLSVIVCVLLVAITKPDTCPICGCRMRYEIWTNEEGKEVSAQVCTNCGYEDILKVE